MSNPNPYALTQVGVLDRLHGPVRAIPKRPPHARPDPPRHRGVRHLCGFEFGVQGVELRVQSLVFKV